MPFNPTGYNPDTPAIMGIAVVLSCPSCIMVPGVLPSYIYNLSPLVAVTPLKYVPSPSLPIDIKSTVFTVYAILLYNT